MIYNKLVRDKIPEIIKQKGKTPMTHIANNEEYKEKLYEKLKEEIEEFLKEDNQHELADILEVINAICNLKNISQKELELIRKEKVKERGSFKDKIILEEVS